jgi:hypothetical protein
MNIFNCFKNILNPNKEIISMPLLKLKRFSTIKWSHIIIHHTATVDGQSFDWESIDKYHVQENGWSDIGYHFGLEKLNNEYVFCIGRGLNDKGAHCADNNMNSIAIGVCLVGNYDIIKPSDEQYFLLASICRNLIKEFEIPIENIEPHSKYNKQKTCPGKLFEMDKLINKIRGGEKNV